MKCNNATDIVERTFFDHLHSAAQSLFVTLLFRWLEEKSNRAGNRFTTEDLSCTEGTSDVSVVTTGMHHVRSL